MSRLVSLTATDGHRLSAYENGPADGEAEAAVVILQEIFGVNAHIRSVADRYSKHGYAVVAPALFDRVERDVEIAYTPEGVERARSLAGRLTEAGVLADIAAAVEHARTLTRGGKVAVVGYCLGGSYAWLSATRLAVDAAVGYYGSKVVQFIAEEPRAPVILHFGDKDRGIPLSDVEAIQAARPTLPVYVYDAGHGFNREGGANYSEAAATLALTRTLDFLAVALRGAGRP